MEYGKWLITVSDIVNKTGNSTPKEKRLVKKYFKLANITLQKGNGSGHIAQLVSKPYQLYYAELTENFNFFNLPDFVKKSQFKSLGVYKSRLTDIKRGKSRFPENVLKECKLELIGLKKELEQLDLNFSVPNFAEFTYHYLLCKNNLFSKKVLERINLAKKADNKYASLNVSAEEIIEIKAKIKSAIENLKFKSNMITGFLCH